MLLDRMCSTVVTVPGWVPFLAGALGAGLYDHGRSAWHAGALRPANPSCGRVTLWMRSSTVRNDMLRSGDGRAGTPWANGSTVDDFGQGLGDRHAQRAITKICFVYSATAQVPQTSILAGAWED